jgi:hypothetical protein
MSAFQHDSFLSSVTPKSILLVHSVFWWLGLRGPVRMGLLIYAGDCCRHQPFPAYNGVGTQEDTLKLASWNWKPAVVILTALWAITSLAAGDQKPAPGVKSSAGSTKPAGMQLPKIWHSAATNHDFRVDVTQDVFTADWVNVPPAAAKRGAFIHTECRRTGEKWVGSSNIHMLFGIPGAPSGKDSKLCSMTVRFEVDSITPEKIAGHSEALHAFDVNTCRIQQTSWGSFTWSPKK